LAGRFLLQRAEKRREVAGAIRGTPPARRRLKRGGAVALAGWLLALFLLLPHATLLLVSFVPPGTWTIEPLPPVLDFSNWSSVVSQTERLRPIINSLWMAAAATMLALLLGFAAAYLAVARRSRWSALLETLIAIRWALLAGASLAFLTALGDFVVSIVLYTFDTRPISIEILSSLRMQDIGAAAAYGTLLAALSAAAFLFWGRRGQNVA